MARPTKLATEIQEKILQAVRAGNYIETAAAYAGIDKTTLYRWLKRGARAKSGRFKEFCNALEKALAEAEVRDVAIIAKAAQEQWQAAAWRLERKFPDRWGRREKQEISGPGGGPIQIESFESLIRQMRAERGVEDEPPGGGA